MARDPKLDDRIIAYLSAHPGASTQLLAQELGKPANTVRSHVDKLIKKNVIEEGLRVRSDHRKRLFKTYIFITTEYNGDTPGKGQEIDYQQQLVQSIHEKLHIEPYSLSLYLESVDIVMGADFDIILTLSAIDIGPIGLFVTNFLRPHRDVQQTKTITVWPSQARLTGNDEKTPGAASDPEDVDEENDEEPLYAEPAVEN